MQDVGVKLSGVASDILGNSGRAMLAALVAGTTDTDVLADLWRWGGLRAKIPALREALTSRFSGHHALIVSSILSKQDLDELIVSLSTEIGQVVAPVTFFVVSEPRLSAFRPGMT